MSTFVVEYAVVLIGSIQSVLRVLQYITDVFILFVSKMFLIALCNSYIETDETCIGLISFPIKFAEHGTCVTFSFKILDFKWLLSVFDSEISNTLKSILFKVCKDCR